MSLQPASACTQLPFSQPLRICVEKRAEVLATALLHRLPHSRVSQPQRLQQHQTGEPRLVGKEFTRGGETQDEG